MEITDRARKLWAWVAEAQYTKSDSEIVAHIALAFIEERQIAFADHGEACAEIADEHEEAIVAYAIRAFSAEASGLPID